MPTDTLTQLRPDGAGGTRRPDGTWLRIPGALPGETVHWERQSTQRKQVTGTLDQIQTPSPDRILPPCPWDAECGGCDLAHLAHTARAHHLGAMLTDLLRWPQQVEVLAAPSPIGHRARVSLNIEHGIVGYRTQGAHDLVAIDTCSIARPEIQRALPALRQAVAEADDPALDRVELRSDGASVAFAFQARSKARPPTLDRLSALGDVALNGRRLSGDPIRWIPVLGHRLRASPAAFYQVHLEQNERMVQAILDRILAVQPDRVLDLYAGIGNFSLPLAAAGVPTVAVESAGAALRDLQHTAQMLGVRDRVTAIEQRAERYDVASHPFDAAILDPPRAGAGAVLQRVLQLRPRRVILVACHPIAARADLQRHLGDYQLTEVFGVDLFPQTHHVEAVFVLDRPS